MKRSALITMCASLLIVSVILCLSEVQAQAGQERAPSHVAVYSPGTVSCGLWLDARAAKENDDVRQIQMEAYIFGVASAYNVYVEGPLLADGRRNVLHVDVYGQRAFLDEYCRQHPTEIFFEAVTALLKHLDEDTHR